jgi:two-component system cell cycle response regulator
MSDRVLIVDDSSANRFMLAQLVRARGCQVIEAAGGAQAIEIVTSQPIDLVLLDIRMPEVDGFAVLEFMKGRSDLSHIPVIIVSSLDELNATIHCISLGAEDYLMKPYEPTLLGARLRASLEKKKFLEELMQLKSDLQKRNDELQVLNSRLETLAFSDPLTGLPNRRFALQELTSHWSSAVRNDRPLACIMVDLDHFKSYNDRFGHDAGDEVLRHAAHILKESTRASDYACRFGGEEFLVICPDTTALIGAELARRLLSRLSSSSLTLGDQPVNVTASFGVAQREAGMKSWNEMIIAADRALYEAKAAGRNCVKV